MAGTARGSWQSPHPARPLLLAAVTAALLSGVAATVLPPSSLLVPLSQDTASELATAILSARAREPLRAANRPENWPVAHPPRCRTLPKKSKFNTAPKPARLQAHSPQAHTIGCAHPRGTNTRTQT